MLTDRIHNRWQAFAVHLAISIVIFIALAALIYRWYPGVLFQYDGGMEGIQLIAGVDLVIGPLLTLLVFNKAKKSLKMDLSIIGALQILCLLGGMWTVYQTRPVAVVYADGAFRSYSVQAFKDEQIDPRQIPVLKEQWPVWVHLLDGGAELAQTPSTNPADKPSVLQQAKYFSFIDQSAAMRIYQQGKPVEHLNLFPEFAEIEPSESRYVLAGLGAGSGFFVWQQDTKIPDVLIPVR